MKSSKKKKIRKTVQESMPVIQMFSSCTGTGTRAYLTEVAKYCPSQLKKKNKTLSFVPRKYGMGWGEELRAFKGNRE